MWLIYIVFSFSNKITLFFYRFKSNSVLLLSERREPPLDSQFILLKATKFSLDCAILSAIISFARWWFYFKKVSNSFLLAALIDGLRKLLWGLWLRVLLMRWLKNTSILTIVSNPTSCWFTATAACNRFVGPTSSTTISLVPFIWYLCW